MALTFAGGASTDRVNCGSAASLDDIADLTALVWVFPTTIADDDVLISKYRGAVNAGWTLGTTGTGGALTISRERASVDQNYTSDTGFLTVNTWNCCVIQSNTTDGKIFHGALTSPLAEVTYASSAAGSGAANTDAARSLFIGNRDAATPNAAFTGDIAVAMVWNRRLTLGELIDQQFRPHKTSGCVLYVHCGFNGTGSQADWSGNANAGTVTGATLSTRGLPLGPYFGYDTPSRYAVSAGGGALPWLYRPHTVTLGAGFQRGAN
jgi:hypothetical protein